MSKQINQQNLAEIVSNLLSGKSGNFDEEKQFASFVNHPGLKAGA